MNYQCPVCGNNAVDEPPKDYAMCDCCGTEFGYHDFNKSWDDLRELWIQKGAKWKSNDIPAPKSWSPITQLQQIGYEVTQDDSAHIKPFSLTAMSA